MLKNNFGYLGSRPRASGIAKIQGNSSGLGLTLPPLVSFEGGWGGIREGVKEKLSTAGRDQVSRHRQVLL